MSVFLVVSFSVLVILGYNSSPINVILTSRLLYLTNLATIHQNGILIE